MSTARWCAVDVQFSFTFTIQWSKLILFLPYTDSSKRSHSGYVLTALTAFIAKVREVKIFFLEWNNTEEQNFIISKNRF